MGACTHSLLFDRYVSISHTLKIPFISVTLADLAHCKDSLYSDCNSSENKLQFKDVANNVMENQLLLLFVLFPFFFFTVSFCFVLCCFVFSNLLEVYFARSSYGGVHALSFV